MLQPLQPRVSLPELSALTLALASDAAVVVALEPGAAAEAELAEAAETTTWLAAAAR